MKEQQLWTKPFVFICLSNFFQFMTFYILMSTLPIFVLTVLRYSQQEAGIAVSAFMISGLIVRPLTGKWVDRFEKRKILIVSLLFFFLINICYLGQVNLWMLILLRFLQGTAFGVANTITATLAAEVIPEKRKGEGIAYFASCMSLAVALGPFVGLTIITQSNFTVLFISSVSFSFCALVVVFLLCLPKGQPHSPFTVNREKGVRTQFFEQRAIPSGVANMCIIFAFSGIATFVPLYAQQMGISESARYLFIVYVVMVMATRPFAGRLFDRLGANIVVYPSVLIFAIGLVILSLIGSSIGMIVVGGIVGVGFGSLFSSLQTIAVSAVPINRAGLATSTFLFLNDLGLALGPLVLGILASYSGYRVIYLTSAAIVILAGLFYYLMSGRMIKTAN